MNELELDESHMHTLLFKLCFALTFLLAPLGITTGRTQDAFNQNWVLNPSLSNVYMQTVKANSIFETHRFNSVEGGINANAEATVRIDLSSINSSVDIRDVRLRFVLFETFKFPFAEITARIDKSKLQGLVAATRIEYPLTLSLNMHGIVNEVKTRVWVTRINEVTVSVSSIEPIILTASSVGLTDNIAKLVAIIGGTQIATAASITFDLIFATGSLMPDLVSARASREAQRANDAVLPISEVACETRLVVITETGAIYFTTGSAELDQKSAPLLKTIVETANRCHSVQFDVEGHTDNVGDKTANQRLSEQRASAVVSHLTGQGINAQRIRSVGYGDARPVGPNIDDLGRARNRRIEFKVRKQ